MISTRPQPGSLARTLWSGLGAGILVAGLDLAAAAHRGEAMPAPLATAAALAILPALGVLAALVLAPFRGIAVALPLALLAGETARRAALGAHAATLPLAGAWGPIAALLALALAAFLRAPLRRGPRRLAALGLVAAVALFAGADLAQRGRYHFLREAVLLLGLALGQRSLLALLPRRASAPIVAAALAVILGGVGVTALVRGTGETWVTRGSTAAFASWWRLRPLLVEEDDRLGPAPLAPFFGTALAAESRRPFEGVRGVLLVTIDALRADAVGRRPDDLPLTPRLDALAARGRTFTRAYSNSPISQTAIFAAFAGQLPSRIATDPAGFEGVPLVTDRLNAAGVETRASFATGIITIRDGGFTRFDLGFAAARGQAWDDPPPQSSFHSVRPRGEGAWFAWIHLVRPHYPSDRADERFVRGTSPRAGWEAEVRHADDDLGVLLDLFEEQGHLEDALVIVSADHGEAFEEHGATRHGTQLYEESIHVPLVVAGPGVEPGRDARCVSLLDLAPTLEHLFDLPDAGRPRYVGRSLLPLFAGRADPDRDPEVVAEIPPLEHALYNVSSALIGPEDKLVVDERLRRTELYDLGADPGERRDLAADRPARAREARRRLRALQARAGGVDEGVFSAAAPEVTLRERGDRLAVIDLVGFLRPELDLREDELLSFMVQVGRCATPFECGEIARRFADDARPTLRRAAELLRATGGDPAGGLDAFLAARRDEPVEGLRILALDIARRRRSGALEGSDDGEASLALRVARAHYRLARGGEPPDEDFARRSLTEELPHFDRRAALRLERERGGGGLLDELLALYAATDDDQMKIEIIGCLAPYRGRERPYDLLRAELDRGTVAIQEAVFAEILLHPRAAAEFRIAAWGRAEDRPGFRGLGGDRPLLGTFLDYRVSAPVTLFAEGTQLAVFLHFLDPDFRRTRVRLRLGEFEASIIRTSRDPAKPSVFWLPPGREGERIELELQAGRPDETFLAGIATRAAPAPPNRALGVRVR
ncbi:MAG: sulfatase-like hydrolase/transferase [Planctomycetota bacterium]